MALTAGTVAALPSGLSLPFSGSVQVNTISINQVLSDENLISYNKFVQVQGTGYE